MKEQKNFFTHPTLLTVIICVIVWTFSTTTLLMDASNNFKESPFQKENFYSFLMIIIATISAVGIIKNYKKTKNINL